MFRDLKKSFEKKQKGKHGGRGFIEEAKFQREGVKARKAKEAMASSVLGMKHISSISLGKKALVVHRKGIKSL
tara:strand:- start:339 stop:557 length:219 start_codon:yes stop_codon:yes gene_type:complete